MFLEGYASADADRDRMGCDGAVESRRLRLPNSELFPNVRLVLLLFRFGLHHHRQVKWPRGLANINFIVSKQFKYLRRFFSASDRIRVILQPLKLNYCIRNIEVVSCWPSPGYRDCMLAFPFLKFSADAVRSIQLCLSTCVHIVAAACIAPFAFSFSRCYLRQSVRLLVGGKKERWIYRSRPASQLSPSFRCEPQPPILLTFH